MEVIDSNGNGDGFGDGCGCGDGDGDGGAMGERKEIGEIANTYGGLVVKAEEGKYC